MDELSEEEAPAYALGLNALQRRAVLAPLNRPLEVIAPPGSGKTAVLTRRIEHVLVNNVPPQNVLAVTFTKAAADEMRCRLEKAVGKSVAKRVNISTFHALSLALCRSYSDSAARSVTLLFARPYSSSRWCARPSASGRWQKLLLLGRKPQVAAEVDLLRELPRVHLPPQPTHPGCFRS